MNTHKIQTWVNSHAILGSDYSKYSNTKNCYLDGRYFYSCFEDYPGLCKEPMHIKTSQDDTGFYSDIFLEHSRMDHSVPILIKGIIAHNNEPLHSVLIIIYPETKGTRHVSLFDPIELSRGVNEDMAIKTTEAIGVLVESYLSTVLRNILLETITLTIPKVRASCVVSGYCNAFIILYAFSELSNTSYDPEEIKRYCTLIESNYSVCDDCEPSIEYGSISPQASGALVGGLGGLAIGGLAGGAGGALLGGTLGALGGYAVGSLATRQR